MYKQSKELLRGPNANKLVNQLKRFAVRVGGKDFKEGISDGVLLKHSIQDVEGVAGSSIEFRANRVRHERISDNEDELCEHVEYFVYRLEGDMSFQIEHTREGYIEKAREYFYWNVGFGDSEESEIEETIDALIQEIEYFTVVINVKAEINTDDRTISLKEHVLYYIGDEEDGLLIDRGCLDHESSDIYYFDEEDEDAPINLEDIDYDQFLVDEMFKEVIESEFDMDNKKSAEESVNIALGMLARLRASVYEGKG